MASNIGSQLVSKLGSANSRIPLAAKDIFNSAGYTYFSYDAGGSIEGKDRFVDEVGTGALWLFGIPVYKKLIDKTLFKKAGISPEVDVRVVKDSSYLQQALKNAPDSKIFQELKKAGENVSKTKNLTLLKFALSLALTMASYFALTKFKQNMTKKNIEKEFLKEHSVKNDNIMKNNIYQDSPVFAEFNSYKKYSPSFGSAAMVKKAEEFMLNPIKNMLFLDMCISGQRLANARTDGEFKEYAIKEGSFLFFVYGADKVIKKAIDKISQKFLNCPIKLDAKFLTSGLAEQILTKKELQNDIKTFSKKLAGNKDNTAFYDFIFNNPDNIVVKAAKKSGIISTIKDSNGNLKTDTRKYIDPKQIKDLVQDLIDFINSGSKAKDTNKYLKKVKALKVGTTLLNVAICCFSLGYLVPKIMYNYRQKNQNGKNDFHVKTEYEKELASKQAKSL